MYATARHHRKGKDDLSVVEVQADLVERGATVLIHLTQHAPSDLIAYVDELFFRIQEVPQHAVRVGQGRLREFVGRPLWHPQAPDAPRRGRCGRDCPETGHFYDVDPSRFVGP